MKYLLVLLLLFSNLFSIDRGLRKVFESESKIALIIGNSKYPKSNHFDSLKNPESDVKVENLREQKIEVQWHGLSVLILVMVIGTVRAVVDMFYVYESYSFLICQKIFKTSLPIPIKE